MKKILFLLVLLFIPLTVLQAQINLDVKEYKLDNGLILLVHEDHTVPTVSVQTFVNAGSRDEDRSGITGLAHVFEHMMFRGTEKFPSFSDAVAPLGAQNNAYTTEDYTCYFVNAKAEFLDRILEIESDRIKNLLFTKEAFRRELGPVKEERRRGVVDSPDGFLSVQLTSLAFTTHTYQHPVIGWEEDLEVHMTFEDGLQFKNRFYVPNNCYLVITGNVESENVFQLASKYYADWQMGEVFTPQITVEPKQEHERVMNFAWKDDQISPLLSIAYHIPAMKEDYSTLAALRIVNEILFSRSGWLTRELKNNMSLVESISGSVDMKKDPGLYTINIRLKRDSSLDEIKDSIFANFEYLKTTPINQNDLIKARNNLRAKLIYKLNRPARIAGSIGYYHLTGGSYQKLSELYNLYDSITPEQIMTMVNEIFANFNRTVVTLVPKG